MIRDGAHLTIDVRSGLRPSEATLASNDCGANPYAETCPYAGPAVLGMQLQPDPNGGLVVDNVAPDSVAADSGVPEGDQILRAGHQPLATTSDLSHAAAANSIRPVGVTRPPAGRVPAL